MKLALKAKDKVNMPPCRKLRWVEWNVVDLSGQYVLGVAVSLVVVCSCEVVAVVDLS